MDINRIKSQFPGAEIVGTRGGKSVVRVYTEEKGWQYEKVADDAALDAFATRIKAPAALRGKDRK